MTHDQLLIKLLVINANESEQTRLSKTTQALRLIVELHKPIEITLPSGIKAQDCFSCVGNNYPCETIQAIDKELA